MTRCENCKFEQAHITKIGGVLRWLCWECTKKAVLEKSEQESKNHGFRWP